MSTDPVLRNTKGNSQNMEMAGKFTSRFGAVDESIITEETSFYDDGQLEATIWTKDV